MPDGIDIIGFEFLTHGKDHSTAEQTNRTLTDYKEAVGDSEFSKIPWLKLTEEDIGFA